MPKKAIAMPNVKPTFLVSAFLREQIAEVLAPKGLVGVTRCKRVVFVGRSNVGKSSLLNTWVGSDLARVSKKPGKTRLLNFFFDPESKLVLVDVPGYGFAERLPKERQAWEAMLEGYFRLDKNIAAVLLLIDARHFMMPTDQEAHRYFVGCAQQVVWVLTKYDLLKTQKERSELEHNISLAVDGFGTRGPAHIFMCSAKDERSLIKLKEALVEKGTEKV